MADWDTYYKGKYNYFKDGEYYSEELFSVKKEDKSSPNSLFESESLTRMPNGEFLRVIVKYLISSESQPIKVEVSRYLGENEAHEVFSVSKKDKTLSYTFECDEQKHQSEKIITNLSYIATPCFATSMLMTLARGIDSVHRTRYSIATSKNIWKFEEDFQESEIFLEQKSLEPTEITIGENKIKSNWVRMLHLDEEGKVTTKGTGYDIYLSKHMSIPYKADFGNGIVIEIDFLKNLQDKYKNMF